MSAVLVELAHTLTADFPIQSILDHLVQSIREVIDVTGAGVVLMGTDDQMHFVASSDESVRRMEDLQLVLGEGPCLQAYETGERVLLPDLANDQRFPKFSRRASKAGITGMYTFPLRMNGACLGALDMYRADDAPLEEAELVAAQILADVAAAYLFNAQARADMRELAAQSHHAAMHDPLTGLPNRALLSDRLDQALRRSPRASSQIGLLFLDLDRFKAINDVYGHHVGDEVLVTVGNRLTAVLRPGDTLSRLAGDEFVVLCEALTSPAQIHEIAGRVLRSLAVPFTFERGTIILSGSVGVTFTRKTDLRRNPGEIHRTADELLRQADAAMYQAKHAGGGRYVVVTAATRTEASQRSVLERDLPQALRNEELHLAYQPIADSQTGEWRSVEALVRWSHPTLGVIDAETIVATAERTGIMSQVGRWVLDQACLDLARWRSLPELAAAGLAEITVAVNVSPTELLDPSYVGAARTALAKGSLPAAALCLELTESVLVEDSPTTLTVLDALKGLGISLALDDFGTGYSTLTYLRRLPADIVKVDRSFLAGFDDPVAAHDHADREIVSALITLSHALGLTVVAEGVETQRQLERLRLLGCDQIQGHLISPPVPARRIPEILARRPEWVDESISLMPAQLRDRVAVD